MRKVRLNILSILCLLVFSLPLIYQPVHRIHHLQEIHSHEKCCHGHGKSLPMKVHARGLQLEAEHEHCFICEYELVSFALPETIRSGLAVSISFPFFPSGRENIKALDFWDIPTQRGPPAA